MKRLLCDFLWSHLRILGAFSRSEQLLGAAREAAGLLPAYDRWLAECVRVLEIEGYLERRDDRVLVDAARGYRPLDELWREWSAVRPRWQGNPDLAATHLLVETTLRVLPDVLTGRRRATEVMFPGGSVTMVEDAYKSNPSSAFFSRALAAELVAYVRRRAGAQPGFEPRILEVGAGTGATSAVVLDAIRAEGLAVREYRYTDLSQAFLEHAEQSYGPASPFLSYGILDIERAAAEQGIAVGAYDAVIAANVLHTTRNIRDTLRNAKAPLKRGGILLLNEVTANNLLNQFTFGLLEGWWRYDDAQSRIPGSPLLSVESWRRVLAEEGYGPISLPVHEAADLGQQVIVAESDGVVRQAAAAARGSKTDQAPWEAAVPIATASATRNRAADHGNTPERRLLDHVAATVLDVLAESLRVDRSRIARDAPFANYGLDSIFAVKVARAVGERLDIDLDLTVLFEYSTVVDLSEFIVTEYASEMKAQPSETPDIRGEDDHGAPAQVIAPAWAGPTAETGQEAMAVVGMSARFPGTNDVEEFWRVVEQGERCITNPPARRADWALLSDGADTAAIWGGFMDEIHGFDPLFFGMSMTEARQVTPELRLMLMEAWNTIEDAGYRPAQLRTRPTGVFIATTTSEYEPTASSADGGLSLTSSPAPALIPNRISYLLDLQGPSEQCDTTCSSSLVALHRAIRSIRAGECEQALVGGVNLVMSPARFAGMREAGMLSPTGEVRPFQQDADGTVRSEGVGAVLIKPLSRAIGDGDTIYGIVRGTGVAHGGKGMSFTAPNVRGMKSAIARAYADAGIDPGTVSYVEAHGMSSMLADGAEIAALRASLGEQPAASAPGEDTAVYVGCVKPSIGHTEVFSGMAALVKTLQAARRGVIPAIPGFGRLHADVSLEGTRLRIASESVPWPVRIDADGRALPRRASINSFGIGGVNAHVVLEQHVPAPGENALEGESSPQVLVLSAKTGKALRERARRLVDWLTSAGAQNWADVAYTLQVGREAMDCRLALVAAGPGEAAEALGGWLDDVPEMCARVAVADGSRRDRGIADSAADTDDFIRSLVAQGRMDLMADRWVAGASVDWSLLHEGARRRRIPLPGYPFEQRTCFDTRPRDRSAPAPAAAGETVGAGTARGFVTGLVASVLGLETDEIDSSKALADYGLNSLLLVATLGRLRGAFPAFQPDWLRPDNTLDEVVARLSTVAVDGAAVAEPRFPELVHLNGVAEGRPVFWIHGALASVELYRTIAAKIDRPFYGIQARGFLTQHAPIEGIPKIAEYYAQIIRAVQPEGPYDLGGFCLGGIAAYEVTRLLQQQGRAVGSLIMVDSPDGTTLAGSGGNGSASARSAAIQVVNSLLWPAGMNELAEVIRVLIHQDEVGAAADEAEFVRRLADLAAERGLSMSRAQIAAFTRRNVGVQLAYRLAEYEVRPLTDPRAVDSTYFRNCRGLFLGDLAPYFRAADDLFSLDHVDYLRDWERELPGLRVVDIDAANHMTLLHEDGPLAAIEQACRATYSGGGAR